MFDEQILITSKDSEKTRQLLRTMKNWAKRAEDGKFQDD